MASRAGRIGAWQSPQLQATILAINGFDKELQGQIRKATKSVTQAEWTKAVATHASTNLERRVLVKSARVAVSNQNISLRSGQLATRMSGGGRTYDLTPGVEFGSAKHRQFKARNRKGYVVYPAAADIIPRIAALWVQTMIRTLHETLEKGTG